MEKLATEQLLTMLVFQMIELNALLKKLNYISGTDRGISEVEIAAEFDFLSKYVKCVTDKGTLCPIRGIVKKLDKHLGEEEIEEYKEIE